jgi:archaellum component FlaF (FlaF/FlaG flagellin family)
MNLVRRKRGVSGIISGLFLVAASMMMFSMFYWQYVQQDHYNQVASNRMQREWERLNEKVFISDYLNYGAASYLRLKIRNIGSVTAHIVTAYLNDTTTSAVRDLRLANYTTSNCSTWISPGTEKWINTTISLTTDHQYDLKVATERGNLGIYLKLVGGEGGGGGQTPQGVQTVPFTFSFRPEDYQYSGSTGGPWYNAWVFNPSASNLYFRLKVKNTAGGAVTIQTRSHMNFVITGGASAMQSKANTNMISALSLQVDEEGWIVFGPISRNNFDNGVWQYYNFIAVFFNYQATPSTTLGTTVGILSSEITR